MAAQMSAELAEDDSIAYLARPRPVVRLEEALGFDIGRLEGLDPLMAQQILRKVTELHKQTQRLEQEYAFDELTGALRRGSGMAAMEQMVAVASRENAPLTVAFVDVDHLKEVNDTLGHAMGDRLLKAVVEKLHETLRRSDLIIRYGGDEFVCALPNTTKEQAENLFARVAQALSTDAMKPEISVGVVEREPLENAQHLMRRADAEMYAGRSLRRGDLRLYAGAEL